MTMRLRDRIPHLIGIPHAALLSVVYGLFIAAFPMGAYVVFDSDIGEEINYDLPITHLSLFEGTQMYRTSANLTLGDAFVVLWTSYAILFAVATLGPNQMFSRAISGIMTVSRTGLQTNYMIHVIMWFSILVLVSVLITEIQDSFGIKTSPPDASNLLVEFFYVTLAPIIEEAGFRLLLVGIPVFLMYSSRSALGYFARCLWRPGLLEMHDKKRALFIIAFVGVLFGFSHIALGDAWTLGKFAQATASGVILGWVYIRYGFVVSVLIHWAANYFVFSYAHFISQTHLIGMNDAFVHPMMSSVEIILLTCAVLSIFALVAGRLLSLRAVD